MQFNRQAALIVKKKLHGVVFGTYRSNNVSSEESISLLVTKNLHQSICILVTLSAAVGSQGELAYFVWNSLE